MAGRSTFKQTLAIFKESAYGIPPADFLPWWQGGNGFFMPIVTNGITPVAMSSQIDPITGQRWASAYPLVQGNRQTAGDFAGPVMPASIGALLMMLFGSVVSTPTADAANPLGTAADLSAGPIVIADPTTSASLEFDITAAAGTAMSIALSGLDANGRTVAETIPVTLGTGAATVNSRYNYTSGIVATPSGFSSGAVNVDGFVSYEHVYALTDDVLTYNGVNLGDPSRPVGDAGFYGGGMLTSLQFEFNADADADPFNYTAGWLSQYPTTATEPNLFASIDRPYSSWNMSVKLGGAGYFRVQAGSFQYETGANHQFFADGTQDPRCAVAGKTGLSGQLVLVPEDETEWDDYKDANELDFEFTIANPSDLLAAGTPKQIVLEQPRTQFTAGAVGDNKGAQQITMDFTPVIDQALTAPQRATLTNNVPTY